MRIHLLIGFMHILIDLSSKTSSYRLIWWDFVTGILLCQWLIIGLDRFITMISHWSVIMKCCCMCIYKGGLVYRPSLRCQIMRSSTDIEAILCAFIDNTFVEHVILSSKSHI